jgi:hypothetical protein
MATYSALLSLPSSICKDVVIGLLKKYERLCASFMQCNAFVKQLPLTTIRLELTQNTVMFQVYSRSTTSA